MRKSCDFTGAQKNPYAKRLEKQVTIRLDKETIEYFKALPAETQIPYQTLMTLYLRECASSRKTLKLDRRPVSAKGAA